MPLFDYKCGKCEHVEEVLQKRKDPPPLFCSGCGTEGTLAKTIGGSNFQLKGGCWAKDLYASVPPTTKVKDSS